MRWFLKALKHYADFSGRARRREYWFFVLFNILFSFAWVLLLTLAFMLLFVRSEAGGIFAAYASVALNVSYIAALMLPSLAVSVRRMHDLGKSGWALLIGFIPLVGGIFLLVWMLRDSQPEENKYGPNPKTSPETFSEKAKLKSAAITLMVASGILFLVKGASWMMQHSLEMKIFRLDTVALLHAMLLLAAGIFLAKAKQKATVALLLAAASLFFIWNAWSLVSFGLAERPVPLFVYARELASALSHVSMALFAAFVLFALKDKNLLRIAAVSAMGFAGLNLLQLVYVGMRAYSHVFIQLEIHRAWAPLSSPLLILVPLAYIVLASTFCPPKELRADAPPP
jgi:uncharacterized membrane protein YhaH (DUF805 family)